MKKFLLICLFFLVLVFSLTASRYLSVPTDDPVYRIIENASYRGIIDVQSSIKPYTYSLVKELLLEIRNSSELTDTERAVADVSLSRLAVKYGESTTDSFSSVFKTGYYKVGSEDTNLRAGGYFYSNNRVGYKTGEGKVLDSRNGFSLYLRGDFFDTVSYNANVGMEFMKINTNAYLFHDTPFNGRGNYWFVPREDALGKDINNDSPILYGVTSAPEVSTTLLDGRLNIRIATLSRTWGPADHNLDLSDTAYPFTAFELSIQPFDWLQYTVLHGSPARLLMKSYGSIEWAGDHGYKEDEYDNMFSIHRLDVKIGNFDAGIYESVVWRKRFEITYLAPFGIMEVLQNENGNMDNMVFGADFSYTLKDFGKVFFAASVDEISSLNIKHFITDPRHVFAFQGGISVNGKLGSFSVLKFQATYISPFYGAHYTVLGSANPWGTTDYETNYVSGGKNLFYPIDPDTIELKISYDVSINENMDLSVSLRDQMRSAQYAVTIPSSEYSLNGTDIFTSLIYRYDEDYEYKNPFKNIWKNTLVLDSVCDYRFKDFPLTLTFGITGIVEWERPYVNSTQHSDNPDDYRFNQGYYNLGTQEYGPWKTPDITAMANIGIKVYL